MRHTKSAYLMAAIAAVTLLGVQGTRADNLTWDSSGISAPTAVDGGGTWDLSNTNWIDSTGTNVAWTNTTPANSAIFGNPDPTASANTNAPYEIDLGAPITVQDLTFGTASDGTPYGVLTDAGGGSLTLNGNINKATGQGADQIFMLFGTVTLGTGDHTFMINDTPGDKNPEFAVNAPITGDGNVIIDNGSYVQWGTTAFTSPNTYTGTTSINKGRLVITDASALGDTSAGTTISNQGSLSIGGGGTIMTSGLNISEPITITRDTYTGTDYSDYPDALVSANTGNAGIVNTFTNLLIDSTDARIAANTSTLVLPNPLVAGPDVAAGTAVVDFDGDFAGAVNLNADNTAFAAAGNSIEIRGGVEVNAANDAALGGANSNLILTGGTIHITSALLASNPAFATNFGGHSIVNGTVGTGVDVDQGLTFTVNGLTGGGVGMRGGGTLNFTGTNTFTGTPYYDGVDDGPGEGTETDLTATGVVNFEAGSTSTQKGLKIRSATVNVMGTLNVGGTYTSIGVDSGGSNGTPDYGTVNISGSGSVVEGSGDDFNVSDNPNTHGTINLTGNGNLTVGGTLYLGKNAGGVGTVTMADSSTLNSSSLVFVGQNDGTGTLTQTGGSINLTRNGNFTFVVDDGRGGSGLGSGTYNLSGGSLTSAGEIYVGEGKNGNGTWNQTGGDVSFSNWFVVGREGGTGTVNISGGTMTKTGTVGADPGSQFSMGEGGANVCTMTVSGTGVFVEQAGEFYVGNNSSVGVLNVGTAAGAATNADATASVTVNNWFAVGRAGASTGTVNLYDGTLTQATNNWFDISGDGGSSTGTVNVYGGTLNALQMYIGENGSGHGTLNINGGNVNITKNSILASSNSVTGTLNLNGGTLTAFGFQANNGGGTGKATFVFNGGTLAASADNTTAFVGAKVTSVVSTGGAIIDSNGHAVTITSALTHDANLSGADGGLTKLGAGTLALANVNTYTGATTVSAGTLKYTADGQQNLSSLSIAGGATLDVSGGSLVIASGLPDYLADIQRGYDNGKWDGTSASDAVITSSASIGNATGIGYSDAGGLTLKYTWLGDTDLDGAVTSTDLDAMHLMASGATWANGDFNYDGVVNADDFAMAMLGASMSGGGNISQSVPEPGVIGMVALIGLAGLSPRRRRKI